MADSAFWYNSTPQEAWKDVFDHVRGLEESQRLVHSKNLKNDWLYNASDTPGLGWSLTNSASRGFDKTTPTDNVVRSAIDTARSMIARSQPRPSVQTQGADWSTQRRARKLERFLEGVFRATGIYQTGPMMFRDAGIYGTGGWKVVESEMHPGRIGVEKVVIDDIVVDELECRSNLMPRQLHHRHFVDKEVLKKRYPKFAGKIETAAEAERTWTSYRRIPVNQVAVVESIHLPSHENADDGRFGIFIDGATLKWEDYEMDSYPYVFYRWGPPTGGFYGKGIAEELAPIQLRLNQVNRFIQLAQDHYAIPRLVVDRGALLTEKLTNRIEDVVEVRPGSRFQVVTPQAVRAEMYEFRRELIRSAFEKIGISTLSAQSLKPAGLESAVALREHNDIEAQRFVIQSQDFEHAHVELAWRVIELGKSLHSQGKKFTSVYRAKTFVEQIDWSEVEPDNDCFCLSVEPASLLSRTPAGRTQQALEWMESGLIDRDEGRGLLGHPDLEKEQSIQNAAKDNVDYKIEKVLEGENAPPSPFDNLALYAKRFTAAYLRAEVDGAPPEILSGLQRHIEQAQRKLMEAASPATAPVDPMEAQMAAGDVPPEAAGLEQALPPDIAQQITA